MSPSGLLTIRLASDRVIALRPFAEDFAAAVEAGARGVARIGRDGSVEFASEGVAAVHRELGQALADAFAGAPRERIEERSGAAFATFVDRVVAAWLRAEPGFGEFLRSDPRGNPSFLFDVLRAELGDLGIDFQIEASAQAYRVEPKALRRALFIPVVGGAWVGAGVGWMVEMALGIELAAGLGFFVGIAAGILLALYTGARAATPSCSECATPAPRQDSHCRRCGAEFVSAEVADPGGDAPAHDGGC